MANVGSGIGRLLIDQSGDPITDDSSNALKVKLVGSDTINANIGDVDMEFAGVAASVNAGAMDTGTLRVTLATDDTHFGAVGAADDQDGTIHAQLGYIGAKINSSFAQVSNTATNTSTALGTMDTMGLALATSDVGHRMLVVRNDALANLDGNIADGDFTMLQTNAAGALYVDGSDHTQPVSGTVTADLSASTNTIEVVGDVAENENAAGNPVLVGGRYDSSPRTLGNTDVGAIALNDHGYVKIDWEGDIGETSSVLSNVQASYNTTDRNLQVAPAIRNDVLAALGNSADGDWTPVQTDALGAVYTTHGITGGADGVTTVSSAGTDVVLGGDVACKKIDIQAQTDNTGLIAVGFTGVDATEATGTGVILYAGDTYSLEMVNLNLIYIDSTVSGEGVRYTYFT